MDKKYVKDYIARRVANELKDGFVVNLGVGLPTLCTKYLPEGVKICIDAELGIVGQGATPMPGDANYDPLNVVDAGGSPASVAFGGSFTDSATNFGLIRGGHVDAVVLGCMEVDEEGNLANWIIPGKSMAGMGGAMDLCMRREGSHRRYGSHRQGQRQDPEEVQAASDRFPLRHRHHHRDGRDEGRQGSGHRPRRSTTPSWAPPRRPSRPSRLSPRPL